MKEVEILLQTLEQKEIKIWLENGRLCYQAPKGVMNNEVMSQIKQKKDSIIMYFKRNIEEAKFEAHPEERYSQFPLTNIQNSYVVGRNNAYTLGNVTCHGYIEITYEEELNIEELEKAWNKVIQKHDMLRVIVYPEGYQKVQEKVPYVKIPYYDLKGKDQKSVERGRQAVRQEYVEKQYELGTWPMCDLVLSVEDGRSVIHFSLDMLITDFMSANLILDDLDCYYHGREVTDTVPTLYRDIVLYNKKKEQIKTKKRKKDEYYWDEKVLKMGSAPELYTGTPEEQNDGMSFRQLKHIISKEGKESLYRYAKELKVTPSVLILAAFGETINLWSKNHKFCVNMTMLNRDKEIANVEQVVGDFTDVNIFSFDYSTPKKFKERVNEIQVNLWEDIEHNSVSGVEVLRNLGRRKKENLIIPVVYTSTLGVVTNSDSFLSRNNISFKLSQTPQVWIDCQVAEENGGITLNWDYRTGVFEKKVISQMFTDFSSLVEQFAKENQNVLEELAPIQLAEKTKTIREMLNHVQAEYSDERMTAGFSRSMTAYPNKTALITKDGEYTYQALAKYVYTIQQKLLEVGIQKGDTVAVMLPKNVWQIAGVLGALYAGGVYLPIDPKQPLKRRNAIIEDSGVTYILTENGEELRERENLHILDVTKLTLAENVENLEDVAEQTDVPAYIIYTSGTTGRPKGVVISHKAAMNTIFDINKRYEIGKDDVLFGLANLAFDLSVYDIFGTFAAGATLVLPDDAKKKSPKHLLDLLIINKVTVWNSVPAQMKMLDTYMDSLDYKVDCFLKVIFMSGDWIQVELPESLYKKMPQVKVVSLGGATEAAIWSIYYDIPRDYEKKNSIPYGYPLTNQKFYILNSSLQDCPDGVPGDLYIAGRGLADGYYKDEEKTNAKFIYHEGKAERIYMTGDVGRYDENGVIEFLGRSDNQVKVRGHRIELSEIDCILGAEENVSDAISVVVGSANEDMRIASVVVPKEKQVSLSTTDTRSEIANVLAAEEELTKNIDRELLPQWIKTANKVVLADIFTTLRKAGIFAEDRAYSYAEILKVLKVPKKLHKLMKRWLMVLVKENMIEEVATEQYKALANIENTYSNDKMWEDMYEVESKLHYSQKLLDYLKTSSSVLTELMAGEEDPLNLLFPQGEMDVAMAAYHDNIINQIMNGLATAEIAYVANVKENVKILEVGAGVGGTSLDVVPKLAGTNSEYNFTDLSPFFLNNAKEKMKNFNWVNYGIFDINVDVMEQQFEPMSMDVILAANVLHNAENIHEVLKNLKRLLKPNGRMVILEETRESYTLLTSMEFKDGLTGFTDERAENSQTFFTREQWEYNFDKSGAEIVYQFPQKGDALEMAGQTIYVIQFKDTFEVIDKNQLFDVVEEKLPEYMVPSQIAIWPELPHTANHKIDRKKIMEWLVSKAATGTKIEAEELPQTDLEKAIAKIWCKELNVDQIGRNENFYLVGGDSLLIAQVIAKMREKIEEAKAWQWDELLKEMMKAPTIKALARSLSEKTGAGEKSLVVLKEPEADKKLKATVVFHAGTGTLTPYNMLIGNLNERSGEGEAVYGFTFGDEAEYLAMPTKQTFYLLGKKYGKILSELEYEEYVLIGHCVGGLIALETAHYLTGEGKNVSSVTMLSTSIPYKKDETVLANLDNTVFQNAVETSLHNELLLERTFATLINANIQKAGYTVDNDTLQKVIENLIFENGGNITVEALCNMKGEFEDVGREFKKLDAMSATERMNGLYATIERPNGQMMEHQRKMLNVLFRVFAQNFRCVSAYVPTPYTGKLRVFACEDAIANFFPSLFSEEKETWEKYAKGEFFFGIMKGDHISCMNSPFVEENVKDILDFSK